MAANVTRASARMLETYCDAGILLFETPHHVFHRFSPCFACAVTLCAFSSRTVLSEHSQTPFRMRRAPGGLWGEFALSQYLPLPLGERGPRAWAPFRLLRAALCQGELDPIARFMLSVNPIEKQVS